MAEQAREPWTLGPVIVTGGTGHIGLAVCRAFLDAGATVIAVGSSAQRSAAAGEALSPYGEKARVEAVDVTQAEAVTALFERTRRALGPAAVLVNGAGINFNRMIRDVAPSDFDRIMAINVKSMFLASREACERMAAANIAGRVVNIASGNYRYARPDAALYCASKAAMEMLTRSFALEYGGHGIAVNAVAPGLVDRPGVTDAQFLAVADYYRSRSSQQALATPRDVAEAVLFLASAKAARIAGETIVVDGGYSAGRLDFPRRNS
jgi:NAD(P)-dependent dehydrogenase (short-subunit alcohol dehydrogenase family)